MANERQIKRRIKSAKNITQITKAMQMVSASKMKKAQIRALAGRPYAEKIYELVQTFAQGVEKNKHPLLAQPSNGERLVILISSNKGLLGGLNTNLFRHIVKFFGESDMKSNVFATVGKKGEQFIVKIHGKLSADFSSHTSFFSAISAINDYATTGFSSGEFKEVYVAYSNFINALKQEPVVKRILPISTISRSSEESKKENEFLVEPSVDAILGDLLKSYVENQIRDAVLEAEASEHSARMIAMKNATDNAIEFTKLLTLEYNKARQEKITYEIADMVTARSAVES